MIINLMTARYCDSELIANVPACRSEAFVRETFLAARKGLQSLREPVVLFQREA
jgi:hypothetical protein